MHPAPIVMAWGARERLLRTLAAAMFLIFFQAYMVAPLIPMASGMAAGSTLDVGPRVAGRLAHQGPTGTGTGA